MTKINFEARREKFMPGNIPKWIRCYDNGGETADQYTVVFTGRYRDDKTGGQFMYLGMNDRPLHPQGIGQHGWSNVQIDAPNGWALPIGRKHRLGKRIPFEHLPRDCRRLVMHDYLYLHDLVPEALETEVPYEVVDQYINNAAPPGDYEFVRFEEPEEQPVCLQQGGSTYELYVQLPEDAEEYIKDCKKHTYKAVAAGEIKILGKLNGEDVVFLSAAIDMAQACADAVRELV